MSARTWLIINAGYFGLLGIGYLIAPSTFLAVFYLPEVGEIAPYVARLAGSTRRRAFCIDLGYSGHRAT